MPVSAVPLKCLLQHILWDNTDSCVPLQSPLFICFQLPFPKPVSSSCIWDINLFLCTIQTLGAFRAAPVRTSWLKITGAPSTGVAL